MDEQLATILGDDYLVGLADAPLSKVRSTRAECRSIETQLSYLRRLTQGQHDVVTGELDRRAQGVAVDDVHSLVEALPELLADRGRASGAGRTAEDPHPDELTGELADRFTALARRLPLDQLVATDDATLTEIADELTALEADVSSARRAVFDRIDVVEAELLRRYREDDAVVDDLLGPPKT